MNRKSLFTSLYAAIIIAILTLSGIFTTFASKSVVTGRLNLDLVALLLMVIVSAVLVIAREKSAIRVASAVFAGFAVGSSISLIVLFEQAVGSSNMIFVFQNYRSLIGTSVTFGYLGEELFFPGLMLLILLCTGVGLLTGLASYMPSHIKRTLGLSLAFTLVIGLLENQINSVIALGDVYALALALVGGYLVARYLPGQPVHQRALLAAIPGAVLGVILIVLIGAGGLEANGFLRPGGDLPRILSSYQESSLIPFVAIFALVAAFGALLTTSSAQFHNAAIYLLTALFVLGVLNAQNTMNDMVAIISFIAFGLVIHFVPRLGQISEAQFIQRPRPQQTLVRRSIYAATLFLVLIAPSFLNQYIINVLDLVLLYIIMGIGLNVMVGYAGLLDLGYVASFAIGAYTCAILTTPSVITTGCVPVDVVSNYRYFSMCTGFISEWGGTGILTFWQAWPIAILVSAFTGMALGVPVLGLRGDYLAIVTLGFGEITGVLAGANVTRPLFGAAQGITNVPFPTIDLTSINPDWFIQLNNASSIYYLYVFSVLVAAFVVMRLSGARLGRAWRAIRADEDVAEAMGVHLIRNKLLAFGISSAFAGMGGAIFVAQLRGIYPESFTILVSINVLSLIIIGGLGSIPGVIIGSLMLVGLPEALRELRDYRLLAFGSLLVIAMLMKPEGLLPPRPRKLAEAYEKTKTTAPDPAAGGD